MDLVAGPLLRVCLFSSRIMDVCFGVNFYSTVTKCWQLPFSHKFSFGLCDATNEKILWYPGREGSRAIYHSGRRRTDGLTLFLSILTQWAWSKKSALRNQDKAAWARNSQAKGHHEQNKESFPTKYGQAKSTPLIETKEDVWNPKRSGYSGLFAFWLKKMMTQAFNMEQASFTTQTMQDTMLQVQAMKAANQTMKSQFKEFNMDEIEVRFHFLPIPYLKGLARWIAGVIWSIQWNPRNNEQKLWNAIWFGWSWSWARCGISKLH